MSIQVNDTTSRKATYSATTLKVSSASHGWVTFHTDTGSKFEAIKRLRAQRPDIKGLDVYHAEVVL